MVEVPSLFSIEIWRGLLERPWGVLGGPREVLGRPSGGLKAMDLIARGAPGSLREGLGESQRPIEVQGRSLGVSRAPSEGPRAFPGVLGRSSGGDVAS